MKTYQWAIIGAGPAGIAAVGQLLDHGIKPAEILWLDPHFNVGDLGQCWYRVSSNTKIQLFLNFLHACQSFTYTQSPHDFSLNHLPPHETCQLSYMVEPLVWVTQQLRRRVQSKSVLVRRMELSDRRWSLYTDHDQYQAKHVILATGAVPNALNYPSMDVIPFQHAIDEQQLTQYLSATGTYAIFGSSHSAIMIIKHLVDFGVKKIHNFYRSPCCYAVELDDWILFDNTGLKGKTADWARQHIDGKWPANLSRHVSNEANLERYLPDCDKVIYAVGFSTRETVAIGHYDHKDYNPRVGIIGPGLFGLGIAYPEIKEDRVGNVETQVGLWKFMTYLTKVLPIWLKYPP